MPGEAHGYAQVVRGEPDTLAAQHDALAGAGCVRVWTDRPSLLPSRDAERHGVQLAELLADLRREDVLVVWRLDRLAGSPTELAQLVDELRKRAIALRSLSEGLDSTRPGGAQVFAAITAVGALDRNAHSHDTPQISAAARARGGRPPLLNADAHQQIRAMRDAGQHTIDEIAAAHGVSRPTIYRSLKHTRAPQNPL